jgi:hypothetical protein
MGTKLILAAVVLATTAIGGCRVEEHKNGDNKDVSVATPFGGVKVKTNDATGIEGIGLPVYPGAELVKKKDNGSADVNLSFGKFQLRVKAASYRTPDTPEQVNSFYRNALKQYGSIIQCSHDQPVGTPTRTEDGLTCSDNDKKHVDVDTGSSTSGKIELKAGSKQHQHIVAIEPENSGTKFGLVALDLPIGFSGSGSDSDARQ